MKLRLLATCFSLCSLFVPVAALGQESDTKFDGRLYGYDRQVTVEGDSTALTWLLFIFLGIVGFAVLFKDAKRTHLD